MTAAATIAVAVAPMALMSPPYCQKSFRRCQRTTMPGWERVNDVNTPGAEREISRFASPRKMVSTAAAARGGESAPARHGYRIPMTEVYVYSDMELLR